jgi:hypothetical protein
MAPDVVPSRAGLRALAKMGGDGLDVDAVGLDDRIRSARADGGEALVGRAQGEADGLAERSGKGLDAGGRHQSLLWKGRWRSWWPPLV